RLDSPAVLEVDAVTAARWHDAVRSQFFAEAGVFTHGGYSSCTMRNCATPDTRETSTTPTLTTPPPPGSRQASRRSLAPSPSVAPSGGPAPVRCAGRSWRPRRGVVRPLET